MVSPSFFLICLKLRSFYPNVILCSFWTIPDKKISNVLLKVAFLPSCLLDNTVIECITDPDPFCRFQKVLYEMNTDMGTPI